MNKKKYVSPEAEIISLSISDVLSNSTFIPEPQNPVVSGVDDPIDEL